MRSIKLTRRYADALLDYAEDKGLGIVYQQALKMVLAGNFDADRAPDELRAFLVQMPPDEVEPVLMRFLDSARKRMDLLPVEIISAVPLTDEQVYKLEVKLIRLTKKQLDITTTIDPSLLGGVRIIVDNTVIDESIKRKLSDLKDAVYKGVYVGDES